MINLDKMLFFDIETEPNSLVKDHMPEFSAPTNYKDSAKIARYVEEKEAAFVDKAALDIDFARVSAIGVAMGDNEIQAVLVGVDQTEKDTLAWFWSLVSQAKTICGYNIVGFDLPIIQRRSFLLGITPTRRLFDLKPWDAFTLDLMRRFYHSGYGPGVKYRGLKAVCAMFGMFVWLEKSDLSLNLDNVAAVYHAAKNRGGDGTHTLVCFAVADSQELVAIRIDDPDDRKTLSHVTGAMDAPFWLGVGSKRQKVCINK